MSTEVQQSEVPEARLIKRYANRKLYDTHDSRYVTLQQIATFVRDGEEVRIIDNTSKEDLTNVTLAQIIYEEEKKGAEENRPSASKGTLRTMIQQSGERFMTSLREGPISKLIPRKEDEEGAGHVRDHGAAPAEEAEPEPAAKRSVFASPKEALDELSRLADDRMKGLIGHAITHVHSLQGEVGRLQARIEELEARLVALKEDAPESASRDEEE